MPRMKRCWLAIILTLASLWAQAQGVVYSVPTRTDVITSVF